MPLCLAIIIYNNTMHNKHATYYVNLQTQPKTVKNWDGPEMKCCFFLNDHESKEWCWNGKKNMF